MRRILLLMSICSLPVKSPWFFLSVGLTSRVFKASISLQGSLICKWYVEPNIPEAHSLRQRFISLNGNMGQPVWHGSAVPTSETEQIDVATLAVVTIPHTIYNKKYFVNVKIKCLKDNQPWWYNACALCNRHAVLEGDVYRCSVRKCSSTKGGPRYRLPLIVIDPASSMQDEDAPSVELVIFGPKAEEVLGIPVHSLIAMQSGIGSFLPAKITDLYGRKFRMRINLSPSSLDRKDISFQVTSIFPIPTADTGVFTKTGADNNTTSRFNGQSHMVSVSLDKSTESTVHCHEAEDAALGSKLLDEEQDTISLSRNVKCTSSLLQTPCSAERKTYKHSRDDEDQTTVSTEEGISLANICKEKSKAVKKLKFDATAKEK